ncbi:MAG TPA: hypothetical protein VGC04_01850 [Cellulomonas sp.]
MRRPAPLTVSWRRAVITGVAALVALAVVVLVGPLVALEVDEGAVPPVSAARLPEGVRVVDQEQECGSGGCWWELTLSTTDGRAPADLLAGLGASGETCGARSWIDRRTVCTGLRMVGSRLTADVQYRRPLGL